MSTSSVSGAVVTSSSSTYISSISSGLDTGSLIEAAVSQKTARADSIDVRMAENEAVITAYESVQTMAQAIADAVEALATPDYSALGNDNAFDAKEGYMSASDGSDGTGYLAVSVDNDAIIASYDVEVVQIAKAMKVASSVQSGTTALAQTGSFTIGLSGGDSVEIAVTSDMTLSDIADAINDESANTGVGAILIKISTDQYQLVLAAQDTAVDIEVGVASGDDIMQTIGITDSAGDFATVSQAAQSAIVKLDGVEITQSDNELDDVIPGISISLLAASSGTTITLEIGVDSSAVKTAITDFIEAYNELRTFITAQQAVDEDGAADDAVLFADALLRNLNATLYSILNATGSGDIGGLADLGIVFNDDNTLSLDDETTLDSAILSNLSAVQSFFETTFEASDSNLVLMNNDNMQASLSFTLNVTVDGDGAITDVLVNGESGYFTVSGNRLVGVEGTIYEGLTFALVTDSSTSIDVSITQGFANKLVNLLNEYADTSSGLIQQHIDNITDRNADLSDRADRIRERAEDYRTKLVDKYATMEIEVQAAKLLQQQIDAILGGGSDDDD